MKNSKCMLVALAAATSLVSSAAMADFTVKTDAARDRANLTARGNYPVIKFESRKTRAEVVAELEALHNAPAAAPASPAMRDKTPARTLPPAGNPAPDLYRGA